jgi:hypothetical protein
VIQHGTVNTNNMIQHGTLRIQSKETVVQHTDVAAEVFFFSLFLACCVMCP